MFKSYPQCVLFKSGCTNKKKDLTEARYFFLVGEDGLEPSRTYVHRILSPAFAASLHKIGGAGRNRTDTPLRARDFESRMSTSSITAPFFILRTIC